MRFTAVAVGLMAMFLAAAQLSAQATRTFVSGVGDDANPCSRTAPCKTFAGAISKTSPSGEINVLDPGAFGAVTITKALTIDATGVEAGVMVGGANGITVAAGPTDSVFLRGLDFVGLGTGFNGIEFSSGLMLTIENCRVSGFMHRGISIESSTANAQVFITNTLVHDQLNNGIGVSPATGTNSVVLDHVQVANSAESGLGLNTGSTAYVRDSVFSHNGASGVLATGAAYLFFDSNEVSGNGVGITLLSGATARLSKNNVTGNAVGFNTSGGVVHSFGNNQTTGNTDVAQPSVTVLSQL
jgi:parallel beta-helix repeat protein